MQCMEGFSLDVHHMAIHSTKKYATVMALLYGIQLCYASRFFLTTYVICNNIPTMFSWTINYDPYEALNLLYMPE